MKNFTFTLLLMLSSVLMIAQGSISGTILDNDTGEPLIGASVLLKGTSTGSITDIDGTFQITDVSAGDYTLQLSYTG